MEDAEQNVKEVTCVMASYKLKEKVKTTEISSLFIKMRTDRRILDRTIFIN